ncbi:MAG: sulfatase-like hydrolase/transferase [Chloroflexota bacterium]
MSKQPSPPNILFIMCDQLRADYLSCYGHPHLETPNIDRIAARGVRFDRAYVQSPVCGPSRMSFYTGRYAFSHGATINYAPLPLEELTLGDYLRPLGVRTAIVGKTHFRANAAGLKRLGVDPNSDLGIQVAEGGFEPYFRDDGIHPDRKTRSGGAYNDYLRQQGYEADNPWHRHANGALDETGVFQSGWFMENANRPADIEEEHSETPATTTRAMQFIEEAETTGQSWCLHLSYIKPHWPYIAPAPYHNMYNEAHMVPLNRQESERHNPHPVYEAFMQHRDSAVFQREGAREAIVAAYMGLIKQVDDQIGRLLDFLEVRDELDNTFIVFTSDHGDYLGDHWLGEKDLFHEESIRIPMIVVDPSAASDKTRGSRSNQLIEAIDLVPTFIEVAGGAPPNHRLEGRSLLPLLHASSAETTDIPWRKYAISEMDYSYRTAREQLDVPPQQCRAFMIRTDRWKYIDYEGFRPQLFDLHNDPNEWHDLGDDPDYQAIRDQLGAELFAWLRQRKIRVTLSDSEIETMFGGTNQSKRGVYLGFWSPDEVPE